MEKEKELKQLQRGKEQLEKIKISQSRKLEQIYQSKTWQLLKIYQSFEKQFKSLNKIYLWQRLLLNFKTGIFFSLKPIDFKESYTFDLFYFPIIDWHFRFQRSQQICTQLSKRGHRIFYLKPNTQVINKERVKRAEIKEKVEITKITKNIFEITAITRKPLNIYNSLPSSSDIQYLNWSIEAVKERMAVRNSLALLSLSFWYPVIKNKNWQIIYDCLDELSGFSNIGKRIISQEKSLIKKTNLVIYSSQKLFNKNKSLNPYPLLIQNAADFNHFSKKAGKAPTDIKSINHPIIGYYGAIADWFDEKMVEYLALLKPDWQFVFIGHPIGAKINQLKKLPNLHFFGEKPYQELPSYLYQFDCFIIPFKLNKLILATNPVKVYEVLCSGKPIVSVNLPELQSMKKLLYLAKDKKDFLEKIEIALKEKSLTKSKRNKLIKKRVDFAKANTWNHRTRQLVKGVKKYIYPRVSIIIVSYNSLTYLKKCLKSIYQYSHYPNLELIIVDNASKDKTKKYLEKIKTKDPKIKIILSRKNSGFSGGNNLGIKKATGEYIVLLNGDSIVTENWISKLIKHLENPKVGLVGPVSNCVGNEAKINLYYTTLKQMRRKAKEYMEKNNGKSFEIPMLGFFCAAGRKSIWHKIGPLDEQFKIGFFEDDDYCQRVKKAGYKILCAEDVFIHHFGNQSFKQMSLREKKKIFEKNKKSFEEKWNITWQKHEYRQ